MRDDEYPADALISHSAHRVLWMITWTLFALGMLEWFILGANRPLDPVVSGGLGVLPFVVRRVTTF